MAQISVTVSKDRKDWIQSWLDQRGVTIEQALEGKLREMEIEAGKDPYDTPEDQATSLSKAQKRAKRLQDERTAAQTAEASVKSLADAITPKL